MTITQKILITTVLSAAIGTGIYKVRQISNLRTEAQNLQQQSQLAARNEQLTRERDDALRQAAAPRNPNERIHPNDSELMKRQGDVTRPEMKSSNLPKADAEPVGITRATELAQARTRLERVKKLLDLGAASQRDLEQARVSVA